MFLPAVEIATATGLLTYSLVDEFTLPGLPVECRVSASPSPSSSRHPYPRLNQGIRVPRVVASAAGPARRLPGSTFAPGTLRWNGAASRPMPTDISIGCRPPLSYTHFLLVWGYRLSRYPCSEWYQHFNPPPSTSPEPRRG
jgi:hypothetical protein